MKTSLYQFLCLCILFFSLSFLPHSLAATSYLCSPSCRSCSGPNEYECIDCPSTLSLSTTTCYCSSGTYFSVIKGTCLACSASCDTCDGGTSSDCLSCAASKQLYEGSCYAACTSSQYFDTNALTCKSCNSLCGTCSGSSYNQCESCSSATLTDGACICPSGQYTTSGGGCAACDSSCLQCSGSSSSQCTACASGMILQDGKCLCPTGYYLTTGPLGCSTCDPSCKGCTGSSSSDCTSCNSNLIVVSGQCQCPSGKFYDTSSSTCVACNSRCNSCVGSSSNQCTVCKNNLALTSGISPGTCSCPSGTYLDSTTYTCRPCDLTCAECSGSSETSCTSCITAFYVESGRCRCYYDCVCPTGQYYDYGSYTCKKCSPQCATCEGDSNLCTSCRSGFTISNGACICSNAASCSCPTGYFLNTASSNTCTACYSSCATCSGSSSSSCSTCVNNLVYTSGVCGCPAGQYLGSNYNYCYSCDATCRTCSGASASQCSSCRSGMSLVSGTCVCPSGQYYDKGSGTCLSCDPNCLTCTGPDKNQCATCVSTKTLDSGYCKDKCGTTEYRNSDYSCQDCDSSCKTCSAGTSNSCGSCYSPYILTSNTCPDINTNGCYYSCATCVGPSVNQCSTCVGSWVLTEVGSGYGYCQASCPTDYYRKIVGSQIVCQPRTYLNNALAYGATQNNIQLNFRTDISGFLTELKSSIEVAIQFQSNQPSITYKYTLSITPDSQGLNLNLTFYGHLLPKNVLYITYDLPVAGETDSHSTVGIVQKVQMLRLLEFYGTSSGTGSSTSPASTVSTIGLSANNVFSWTSSVLLRSVHSLRSRAVEDMIGYLVFINTAYTQNFADFADNSLNSFEMLMPNLFQYIIDDMDEAEEKRVLEGEGRQLALVDTQGNIDLYLSSRLFLVNHGAATSLLVISLFLIFFIEALWYAMEKLNRFPRVQKFLKATSISFRWNFLIGHFMGEYQGFIFFSLLQISSSLKNTKKSDNLNLVFAIINFALSSVGVIAQFVVTRIIYRRMKEQKNKKDKVLKEEESTFVERIELLHNSFRTDHLMHLMYPMFLTLRSFLFAFVLVFGGSSSLFQVLFLVLSTVAMIGYLIYYKPLDTHFQQILTVFYEMLFLSIILGVLVLQIYNHAHIDDVETRSVICTVILSLSTCMFGLNLASFAFELVELKNKFFPKKNKITPLPAQTSMVSLNLKQENLGMLDSRHSRASTLIVQNPAAETEEYQQLNIRGLRDMMKKNQKVKVILPEDQKGNKSYEYENLMENGKKNFLIDTGDRSLKNESPVYFANDGGDRKFKFTENVTAENTPYIVDGSKGKDLISKQHHLQLRVSEEYNAMSSFAGASTRLYSPAGISDTEDPLAKKYEGKNFRESLAKPTKSWTQKMLPKEKIQSINLDDPDFNESPRKIDRNFTVANVNGNAIKEKKRIIEDRNRDRGRTVTHANSNKVEAGSMILDAKDNFKKKPRTLGDKKSQDDNKGGLLNLLTNTLKIKAFGEKPSTIVPESSSDNKKK